MATCVLDYSELLRAGGAERREAFRHYLESSEADSSSHDAGYLRRGR